MSNNNLKNSIGVKIDADMRENFISLKSFNFYSYGKDSA